MGHLKTDAVAVEDLLEAAKKLVAHHDETCTNLNCALGLQTRMAINEVGGSECSGCGVPLLGADWCSSCAADAEAVDAAVDADGGR